MPQPVEIELLPAELSDEKIWRQKAARALRWPLETLGHLEPLRRSLDARGRQPVFRLRLEAFEKSELFEPEAPVLAAFRPVFDQKFDSKKVIVVGAGPAGYFAALELIELGFRPVVLDRGKDARARRRDLRAIQQFGQVDPHSNYCFGEGGAGTYSDGKLYTRSLKRGDVQKTLRLLVEHGAKSDILIDAHPHIGSNKLPEVVANIRQTILKMGGEVHFGAFVNDFLIEKGRITGCRTADGREFLGAATVLATGHSARDIYELLHQKGVKIEAKPFALGVRVEHPQPLIDAIQYKKAGPRPEILPASSYSLVCQVGGRGVFSFCMCPGGLVVPAATAPGEIVVNGMSMSRRDSPFANSGIVAAVELADLEKWQKHGPLAAMEFQKEVEQRLFSAGDGSQKGPAARLTDFLDKKTSSSLPRSSYIPGLWAAPLGELLPPFIFEKLRGGFLEFSKKMPAFLTAEAVVIGAESRTSAPVRVPRDRETLMHPDILGFFPCGEGAGYAGGIVSAAMDGQNVARAVARFLA